MWSDVQSGSGGCLGSRVLYRCLVVLLFVCICFEFLDLEETVDYAHSNLGNAQEPALSEFDSLCDMKIPADGSQSPLYSVGKWRLIHSHGPRVVLDSAPFHQCPIIQSYKLGFTAKEMCHGHLNTTVRVYEPSGCRLRVVDPAFLTEFLSRRQIIIVGDSVSSQFKNALECAIESAGRAVVRRLTIPGRPSFGHTNLRGGVEALIETMNIGDGGVASVVIVLMGAWFNPTKAEISNSTTRGTLEYRRTMDEFIRGFVSHPKLQTNLKDGNLLLLMPSLNSGSIKCRTEFGAETKEQALRYASRYAWTELKARSDFLRSMCLKYDPTQMRVRYIDWWKATGQRYETHVNYALKTLDCFHWCFLGHGSVPDGLWVPLVYNVLKEMYDNKI